MSFPLDSPRNENYFQFPLCALAYGNNLKERLNAIISFGLIETGKVFWQRLGQEKRGEWFRSKILAERISKEFNDQDSLHLAALYGADVLKINIGSLSGTVAQHKALSAFRSAFEARHGKDASVRVRMDFLFEARDGGGVTLRECEVLAAIFSVIGKKTYPVRITRQTIAHRASGYKSNSAFQAKSRRADGAKPLTDWELRKILNSLAARKFFCRRTFARRQTYYSHRMSAPDFELALFDLKTRRNFARQKQQDNDRTLTERIRKARRRNSPKGG